MRVRIRPLGAVWISASGGVVPIRAPPGTSTPRVLVEPYQNGARLIYLSKGLAVILGFIAVKLLLHALHETTDLDVPEISTAQSLVVIIGVLVVTAIASLIAVRRDPALMGASPEMQAEHEADDVAGEALRDLPSEPEH